ncbi:MAG: hypothetical protein MMC33_004663 [Icmadophila ericetorum]|nr:hypothetical protein [Icmadophila ericetorum]
MNDTISSIIAAWRLYDKSQLVTIQQINDAKKRMAARSEVEPTTPRHEQDTLTDILVNTECQIEQLREMIQINSARQEEIRGLRDGLFNASVVLEARTSVTQGQNIRILTVVSLVFLPVAVVMPVICVPVYLIIYILAAER